MEQFIDANFDLERPLTERVHQKMNFAICPFCGSTQVDLSQTLDCQNCSKIYGLTVEIGYDRIYHLPYYDNIYYTIGRICIHNNQWYYLRQWGVYIKTSTIQNRQDNKLYDLPFDLILEPANFKQIENILVLI